MRRYPNSGSGLIEPTLGGLFQPYFWACSHVGTVVWCPELTTDYQHQNLFVQFYGWYEDRDRDLVFLAMEYMKYGDLSKYLNTPLDAREITRQLLDGLIVLHERQICHRDIKPQVFAPSWSKAIMLI